MKSTTIAVLAAALCSPVLASEPPAAPTATPTATPTAPVTAAPVFAEMPPASEATPVKPVAPTLPALPSPPASSFCGQDQVYRLIMKAEIGEQLQLRQQAHLQQLLLQLRQPAATPAPATPAPAPDAATPQN